MAEVGILDETPARRLAALEAQRIVQRIATESGWWRQLADQAIAKIENRLIERILISRLRAGLRAATSEELAEATISKMRGAYTSGQMETLPSFLPRPKYAISNAHGSYLDPASRPEYPARVLYVPGGGFIFPISARQKTMMTRLAEQTDCEVVPGTHRLAPEHPFPAAAKDIAAQFIELTKSGDESPLFLGGDTAGASVVLGALQILIEEQVSPLPKGIILFSPWADLSLSGWSYITKSVTAESPFRMETAAFCARLYLGSHSANDPLASPIFADQDTWPPLLIHTSENDLHFDDAMALAENGLKRNVKVQVNYWDSPRHHLERLSSKDAARSFSEVRSFIEAQLDP
ncbi:MAG: alpha/beta hydrolase fold domain-containing protein [Litoreibacter sp.]|uniref:alpha/beta hydrolase fold domain-containing protein n=1 Tax=Litoreibacter sp. TaxID=1969459 RepID=UPI003297B41F